MNQSQTVQELDLELVELVLVSFMSDVFNVELNLHKKGGQANLVLPSHPKKEQCLW